MNQRKHILKNKSFQFSLRIIKLFKYLIEENKEFIMSKQLLRAGTSIGANIREAQNAKRILSINWQFHKKNVMNQ